jgi:hypothetical protein
MLEDSSADVVVMQRRRICSPFLVQERGQTVSCYQNKDKPIQIKGFTFVGCAIEGILGVTILPQIFLGYALNSAPQKN